MGTPTQNSRAILLPMSMCLKMFIQARSFRRKALTRLREAMRQGAFTVVVVYDVDRLSRSTTHLAVLLDEAEHLGVSVEFVKYPCLMKFDNQKRS